MNTKKIVDVEGGITPLTKNEENQFKGGFGNVNVATSLTSSLIGNFMCGGNALNCTGDYNNTLCGGNDVNCSHTCNCNPPIVIIKK